MGQLLMILRTQESILYQKERKMRGGARGASFVSIPVLLCAVFVMLEDSVYERDVIIGPPHRMRLFFTEA